MEHRKLKIAFLGAGGVGGYFGAKVSRQFGNSAVDSPAVDGQVEVIFLAREKTADAIRRNGIKLITPSEEFTARPHRISTDGKDTGPVNFLLCSVKSYDLESSLEQFKACIGPQTIILPLQNGIDATERVQQLFPANEVWKGCVYIVSRIVEPGVIKETGNIHTLHFGCGNGNAEKARILYNILHTAHADVFLQADINTVTWEKFIFISTLASLTSYLDVCLGKILELPSSRQLLLGLLQEIVSVAQAEKIALPVDIIPTSILKMERLPYETTSSMHSDFQRGGKTEFQSLTGYVVKLAQHHGIDVPVYRQIFEGLALRQS